MNTQVSKLIVDAMTIPSDILRQKLMERLSRKCTPKYCIVNMVGPTTPIDPVTGLTEYSQKIHDITEVLEYDSLEQAQYMCKLYRTDKHLKHSILTVVKIQREYTIDIL